ncbi:MAG TPA: SLBB domain-containing protein [Terracidiphilus sp.]|nr:SLBB domain-containing protein [Terracidiphilus sp.]
MIVGADDELRIRVWGQINFSSNLRVSREGEIYLPKIGAVHVAGLPFSEVPSHLRSVMAHVYRNFELSVDMGEIHSVQIYVAGFARRPGEYTVSALSTLVDAVFASGGPAASGSMRHVLLKRSGKVVTDFDLYALLVNGDKTGDAQLQNGDVLFIPPTGPQVAVLGSVREAGIYELRGEESIGRLLEDAGGKTAIASGGHLSLERIENHSHRIAFSVNADPAGLAAILADGDIVRVDPIISNFNQTVTLRGAVASPGHFQWHEGMRLSELLPDRDSLEKRNYWWRRTQLGLPALQTLPTPERGTPVGRDDASRIDLRGSPLPEQAQPTGESQSSEWRAAVESPAIQTNWNYAVIERLDMATMTTSLIPFSLGKLILEHDESQNLALMPGDVVTIFTQSDIQIPVHEQTKYVTLEGEFVHPGIYSVSAGEGLRSVVERAGGLTNQAYLYAAVFTRKSTQTLEQQHLNEFAELFQHQVERNSASPDGVAPGTTSAQAQSVNRTLVEHIRGVRATGRVVLNLHPDGKGKFELPDMHVEDGDRLVVPFKPDTVQVLGAVFNPHAFLFHQGARVSEYLRLAGGSTREADRKRIFVLAADGTVISRESDRSLFERGFRDLRLHPGDSIVVPEKQIRPSALSQALAWSQALSQSSITAAELNTMH